MNPNFSEELQKMYRDAFLNQGASYEALVAAFTAAAKQAQASTSNSSPSTSHSFSLDVEIPREEIECDIEILMVNNLRKSLKQMDTTMNGLHGKKYGFREMVDLACSRPAYPALVPKRNSTTSFGSFNSSMSKKIKLGDDTAESLDKSNASSDDGNRLQIDWAEPEAKIDSIAEEDSSKYDPAKLRIQRMTNIDRKKLKINLEGQLPVCNANMARSFPGTEHRTVSEQLRREKNTTAARVSRLKNRRYETILQEQAMEATMENISKKRNIACLRVYANSLLKLNNVEEINFSQMWESHIKILCSSD